MSNVLLLIEHSAGALRKTALSAVQFAQQVTQKSGGSIYAAILGDGGDDAQKAVQAARQLGIAKVYSVQSASLAHYLAESYCIALVDVQKACGASLVAAAASSASKDLLPRVAARLRAGMATEVLSVVDADTFTRPMWAGNVLATVKLTSAIKVCTVRPTEFSAAAVATDSPPCPVETLSPSIDLTALKTTFVRIKEVKSERPDVTTAERIVSGGRGIKSAEGFKIIEQLADTLHAGVGASRAVCDAGWVPNDLQIGQTGKIVAPTLYVAVGISGAIQHLAGMKGSKTIVAINKDPDAPIFSVADYGLVADLFEAVPALNKALTP
jgi:electron transfer flavoprotein alpha subunit